MEGTQEAGVRRRERDNGGKRVGGLHIPESPIDWAYVMGGERKTRRILFWKGLQGQARATSSLGCHGRNSTS